MLPAKSRLSPYLFLGIIFFANLGNSHSQAPALTGKLLSEQPSNIKAGVYLFQEPGTRLRYARADDGKVFAFRIADYESSLQPGTRIEIENGRRSPVDGAIEAIPRELSKGALPEPREVSIQDIGAGKVVDEYIRVRGFATSIRLIEHGNSVEIELKADEPVAIRLDASQLPSLAEWERKFLYFEIEATGCVMAPNGRRVRSIAVESIKSLLTLQEKNAFAQAGLTFHDLELPENQERPVRIEGVVAGYVKGLAQLWDNNQDLYVDLKKLPIDVRERVEIVGIASKSSKGLGFEPLVVRAYRAKNEAALEPERKYGRIRFGIGEIHRDALKIVGEGQPVRLTGLVNCVPPGGEGFYFEDGTGGIFVASENMQVPKVGDTVTLRGYTSVRSGIPLVIAESMRIGKEQKPLGKPALLTTEWLTSALEGRRVAFDCVIRSIGRDKSGENLVLRVGRPDEILYVYAAMPYGNEDASIKDWIGATVRVRGVFSQLPMPDGEKVQKRVWIDNLKDGIVMIRKAAETYLEHLSDLEIPLERYRAGQRPLLVRTRGTVVGYGDGESLYVQDDTGGLRVTLQESSERPRLYQYVEFVGVFKPGHTEREPPYLIDAVAVNVERGYSPQLESVEDIAKKDLRFRLVHGEGTVLEWMGYANLPTLVVDLNGRTFKLRLPSPLPTAELRDRFKPGTRTAFTGVYVPEINPNSEAVQEAIRLRSLDDLSDYPDPSWWTFFHVAGVVLATCVVVAAIALWLSVLKHRLREQGDIINQQREREEQLEDKYRELFENANDFMFTLDVEGRITSINLAGESLMGYARGELLGRRLIDFVAAEDRNTVESMIESDEPVTFEIVMFDQSLKEICLEISSRPVVDSENVAVHVVGIGRDITRRKLTEHELKRAFKILRSHIENSPLCIIEWDRGMRVTRWSGQAEAIFEWKDEEVLFRHPSEWKFVHEDDVAAVDKIVNALFTKETRNFSFNRNYTKSGKVVYCEWHNSALLDEKGELISVLSLVLDVTQRVEGEKQRDQLEEKIRHVQKMEAVGRLAGGVAHDFNNLLTIINGNSHMLLADGLPRDQRDLVSQIKQAGEKAAALTRQLLAFGRKQIAAPKEIDLNFILNDLKNMLGRLAGERVHLQYDLDDHLPFVLLDSTMAEQVVYNLVVNARDAMPSGGKIVVRTRTLDQNTIRFEVEDTGTGMDDKTKAKIFEPFFTTKAMGKGTGLGLATVYSVVQQANGTIEVESTLGSGTLFRIDLPRSTNKHTLADTPSKATSISEFKTMEAPSHSKRSETILLVEDEDGLRLLARRVLEMNGYRVLVAADAKQALEIHQSRDSKIDLLITDVMMPEMTGVQLVERLLIEEPAIRVIFMSGYTDDEVIHQGVRMEEVHFLQKPFSPPSLLAKVRSVLQSVPALV